MANTFIDTARILVRSGAGGNGAVAFHREKYVAAGGPDGGDGGRGGDVILQVDDRMSTLMDFRYKRKYVAENGGNGAGKQCSGKNGAPLTSYAFETGLPGELGGLIVTIGIILFAYSTILGWSYYGEKAIEYLLGSKAIIPYRWAFIISVGLGASMKLDLVWTLSDIFNALMAFPNLIGLIMLTPVVKAETLAYLRSLKKEPASEG